MANETKACSLTKDEIAQLISWHGYLLNGDEMSDHLERINYLSKRLKAFYSDTEENTPMTASVAGWGTPAKE